MELPQIFESHPYLMALLLAWSLVWKGLALWRASHKESKSWFIALLIVNTFGILDILYLYIWSKSHEESDEAKSVDQAIFQK